MAQAQTVDNVSRTVFHRSELHKPVLPILAVEVEGVPHQNRCADYPEAYAQPLMDTVHIQDYEQHEVSYQTSGEDEQVLGFKALVLHRPAYALVYSVFHLHKDGLKEEGAQDCGGHDEEDTGTEP